MEIDKLFVEFTTRYEEGFYTLPPLLSIYDIAINRYGEENVDLLIGGFLPEESIDTTLPKSLVVEAPFIFFHNIKDISTFILLLAQLERELLERESDEIERDIGKMVYDEEFLTKCFRIFTREWNRFSLLLKYGNITIKNSFGIKHQIRDLYVSIPFNAEGGIVGKILGTRTTLSTKEMYNRYLHSHLPSIHDSEEFPVKFQSFCLGSGELGKLRHIMGIEFDITNVFLLFTHLDIFVGWESLEGVPYKKIGELENMNKVGNTVLAGLDYEYDYFLNYIFSDNWFKTEKYRKELKWVTSKEIEHVINNCKVFESTSNEGKYFRLVPNNEKDMHIFLRNSILKNIEKYLEYNPDNLAGVAHPISFAIFENSFGDCTFHNMQNGNFTIPKGYKMFNFRGREVRFDLIEERNTEEIQKVCHPFVLYYILRELEQSINKSDANPIRKELY